jgi:hypothetical protein
MQPIRQIFTQLRDRWIIVNKRQDGDVQLLIHTEEGSTFVYLSPEQVQDLIKALQEKE